MKQLHEKLPKFTLPLETPLGQCPEVQVSMTYISEKRRPQTISRKRTKVARGLSASQQSTTGTAPSPLTGQETQ